MTFLLLRSTLATLIAFGGGALGVALGQVAPRRLTLLVYAAMGALLAVTVFDVLPDAKSLLSWPAFLLASASGYALFWALGKYVYHLCPACSVGAFDQATTARLGQTVVLLMIALGLHSAMDGVAVVVGDTVAGRPNLAVLLAVSFHKFPEGLALALLLLGAGYGRRTALLWTLGIESILPCPRFSVLTGTKKLLRPPSPTYRRKVSGFWGRKAWRCRINCACGFAWR